MRKGQPLCLIEVMKLFTTINSEVAGRIVQIGAENTELVEYGRALFVIEPANEERRARITGAIEPHAFAFESQTNETGRNEMQKQSARGSAAAAAAFAGLVCGHRSGGRAKFHGLGLAAAL